MADDRTDPVVVSDDLIECDDECVSGSFAWTPGESIQELLEEVHPEDREALILFLARKAHDFLVVVAAAAATCLYDEDGSALEKAQDLVDDASLELNAQFGIMEMEATLRALPEDEADPDMS